VEKTQGQNQFMHELQRRLILKTRATVLEIDYLDKINELGAAEFEVMQYEFKAGVNKFATANAKVKNIKEVIDFNTAYEDKAMPYFKQETLISSNEKKGLDDKLTLNKSHFGSKIFLDDVIKENQLDAIVD
jgi:amidase